MNNPLSHDSPRKTGLALRGRTPHKGTTGPIPTNKAKEGKGIATGIECSGPREKHVRTAKDFLTCGAETTQKKPKGRDSNSRI